MVRYNLRSIIGTSALLIGCASSPKEEPSFPVPEIESQTSISEQKIEERTIYDVCDYPALHKLKLSAEKLDPAMPAAYALRESLKNPNREVFGPKFKSEFGALVNIIVKSLDNYPVLYEKMKNLCPVARPDNFKECRKLHSQVTALERDIEYSAKILSQNYGFCIK